MIKLIKKKPFLNEEGEPILDVLYNINCEDNILKFHFESKDSRLLYNTSLDNDFEINLENNRGKILEVYVEYTHSYGITTCEIYELNCIYNVLSRINNEHYDLARVSISNDLEDVCIYLTHRTNYEAPDMENIVVDECVTKAGALRNFSQFYYDKAERYKLKYQLISKIDIYNTISYLEAQVDSLTKLVLSLLDKEKLTDEEKDNLSSILTESDKFSVLDNKSINDILKEFSNKKLAREVISDYRKQL